MPRVKPVALLAVLIVVLLPIAVIGVTYPWLRLIQLADGSILLARTQAETTSDGKLFRSYGYGVDWLAREELDTDGDGTFDIRGDDWQTAAPAACWKLQVRSWVRVPPSVCEQAAKAFFGM
ncbi:MAG: hypothetical protein ACYC8T_20445 [Myxococcaceae bacterium]